MNGPLRTSPRERVALLVLPALLLVFWLAEAGDVPVSLIDHGEYFWRADGVTRALGRFDLGEAAAYLFERRHPFDVPLGRCRPFYWVYDTVMCSAARLWPAFFLAYSSLVFAAAVVLVGRIARALTGSVPLGLVSQVLLGVASSSTGMWLRVGCHEPVLMLLGGGAFALALGREGANARSERLRTVAACVLMVLFFFTKEITVHFTAALLVAWLLLGRDRTAPARSRRVRAVAITGLLAAATLLVAYRAIVGTPAEGSYSSGYQMRPEVIASRLGLFATWLAEDFLWLVPVVLVSAIVRIARGLRGGLVFADRVAAVLVVECAAYVAIYLPWTSLPERVLPGFTFSFALLAAIEMSAWTRMSRGAGATRLLGRAALASTIVVLAAGAFDWPCRSHREARWLRTRYEADRRMVAELARRLPRNGVALFDLPLEQKELGYGAGLHLALWYGRADARVAVASVPGAAPAGALVASYQGFESTAGRAARAAVAVPVEIAESRELAMWSCRSVLRSAFFLVRRGSWPGVPLATKRYAWRVCDGRP